MTHGEHRDCAEALATLGLMTRSTTHDLNNQVAAIMTFTELVLGSLPHDHPIRAELQEITAAGLRALDKTRELAVLARQLAPAGGFW